MGEFQLIQREHIDDERWNALVKSSPDFRHYYLTYFLDNTSDWLALVLGDYNVLWPIPYKKKVVSWVYQPLLAQQLGPIGPASIEKENLAQMWSWLKHNFWKLNVKFNSAIEDLPDITGKYINVELNLDRSIETIRKNYNRNQSSNLKKAHGLGVQVKKNGANGESIVAMFKKGKGSDIKVLNNKFYMDVLAIYKAFNESGEAETWAAYHNDQICAGALVLKSKGRILNFFTASTEIAKKCGAMHCMFDTIIESHIGKSSVLDFEGSNDPNLAFFYKGFGGIEKVYLQASAGLFPPFLRR